jgi:hypothetical protein
MRWRRPRLTLAARAGDDVPAQARAAFQAGMADAIADLTRVSDMYVDWARRSGNAAQRAEAYWMRSVAAARAATHQALPASQLAVLADAQHIAAQAGYWLNADARPAAAVTVLEYSRAVLLTRLAGGLEPGVRTALVAAGRTDLLAAYLDALSRRADAYRSQYSGAAETAPAISRGNHSFQAGSASRLEAAQADLARLGRQIAAAAGPLDLLGMPSYEVIRTAARDAPVVYLAAADEAGYALIVRSAGQPVQVPLAELRSGHVTDRVSAFTASAVIPRAVRDCVDWLAAAVLPRLLAHLARDEEIALVPLGALNLLPVSAAFVQATAGRPAGPLTVRLLPNARVAVSAAGWPPGRLTDQVLVADATRAPGGEPLPRSGREAEALVRRYGARRLCDATSETVLPAMDTAAMVHFFCHGRADLTDPLSSGLRLMDGWMTVRTLFGRRPLRSQLVILSACESQVGGQAAPDEVIGLPAALFQAGAAGVIASQWKVSEQAALLIMRKFYDQLDAGAAPARALTTAQNWLRTAAKDELISAYPSLFTVARQAPGRRLPGAASAEPPYGNPVHWAAFTYTGI